MDTTSKWKLQETLSIWFFPSAISSLIPSSWIPKEHSWCRAISNLQLMMYKAKPLLLSATEMWGLLL